MTQFNCLDKVNYRGNVVTVVGKRYGHVTNPEVGRMYDLRIGNRIVSDVPEKDLEAIEQPICYVANINGATTPICGQK